MDPAQLEAASRLSGRSFTSFSEATASVLEMLESQLPGSIVYVAHLDREGSGELRIIDSRGDASFGLDPGSGGPLEETFCQRMAFDDAPRLANRPEAEPAYSELKSRTDYDIGSYLGVPLELGDGSRVGSLCALSHESDSYTEADLQLISVMGRLLAYELERQHRERDLEAMSRQLRELSLTDPLTGVLNRRGMEQALGREWSLARRRSIEAEVLVADIDHFKQVNDRHGHAFGDRMIQLVADTLEACARSTDVVARLGGDEFLVILVGAHPDEAPAYAGRVAGRLGETGEAPSLSFGWSSLGEAETPEKAIAAADEHMYARRNEARGGAAASPAR